MTNNNASTSGGRKLLTGILIAANVIMLVVGILTIPPNLKERGEKDAPTLSETETPAPPENYETTPSPPVETPPPAPTVGNFSTSERPDLSDFVWYCEGVQYTGIPAEAAFISELASLTGGWKALVIYDPNNEFDSAAMEFLNISISGTTDDLSLTLDWYSIFWSNEGQSYDESDMEDSVFLGKWENGGLWASGAGTIRLAQFYELSGKQYAVGTMDTPDGIPALVALVRP